MIKIKKLNFLNSCLLLTIILIVIMMSQKIVVGNLGNCLFGQDKSISQSLTDLDPIVKNNEITININFAGNLSDSGGPYWQPSGEEIPLAGPFLNGYYTNDSRQQEDWIYINVTTTGTKFIKNVWLHWYDATDFIWTNWSYQFSYTGDDFWEFNSSGIIPVVAGHDYSFDVQATTFFGSRYTAVWMKTGLEGREVRRFVQLGCTPQNISYMPFYMKRKTNETSQYSNNDVFTDDRLHHDQGPHSNTDTGYLTMDQPTGCVDVCHCDHFTGYWFEDSVCIDDFTLKNIYFRYWFSQVGNDVEYSAFAKEREHNGLSNIIDRADPPCKTGSEHKITYDGKEFYLDAHLLNVTDTVFTDNDIYELLIIIMGASERHFYTISSRSFPSYVIFNVPDNSTLAAMDSDGDNLNDYEELFVYYTSPFLIDTNNDGCDDYFETTRKISPDGPYQLWS